MVTIALPNGVDPEPKSAPVMGNSSGVFITGGMGNVEIGVAVGVTSTIVGVGLGGRVVAVGISDVLVGVGSTGTVGVNVGTDVSVGTGVSVGFGVSVGTDVSVEITVSVGVGSAPSVQWLS